MLNCSYLGVRTNKDNKASRRLDRRTNMFPTDQPTDQQTNKQTNKQKTSRGISKRGSFEYRNGFISDAYARANFERLWGE